jgi:hypothetical protein
MSDKATRTGEDSEDKTEAVHFVMNRLVLNAAKFQAREQECARMTHALRQKRHPSHSLRPDLLVLAHQNLWYVGAMVH